MSQPASMHVENGAVRVEGEIGLQTVTRVLRQMSELIRSGEGPLVFDFSGLERADSAALALLLEGIRQARRQGRELVYRNVPDRLLQLAKISDLEELIGASR